MSSKAPKKYHAPYTVYYRHDGTDKIKTCHTGMLPGPFILSFHIHMQNNHGVHFEDYRITSLTRGNEGHIKTYDEEILFRPHKVQPEDGKTSLKFN